MSPFIRPCEGSYSSAFAMRLHPVFKDWRMHWGVDIGSAGSSVIRAVAAGKVVKARTAETDGYGKVVFIEHVIDGKLVTTVYAHLKSISVSNNQRVVQGQQIGVKGNTGVGTGVHLHFEVHTGSWNNKYTNAVDPMMYIPLEVALKRGDVGPNVKLVQQRLVKVGYLSKADGIFGPGMETAVISFQNAFKLSSDGMIGPATLKAIENVLKPVVPSIPEKPKEVRKLHNPTTGTLKQFTIDFLQGAVDDKSLTDTKWVKQAKAGTLAESDWTTLYPLILERRAKAIADAK